MKKLFLFCLAVACTALASAQRGYFLYLQTDNQLPFYVRLADKIYSSSTSGYVILPNLPDSTYTFGVGFAKSTQPETRFAVTINQTDKGYLIKQFTEGFSLFDLQDLSLVKSVSAPKDNVVYETKTDRFSSVLSKAADDPGLLKVPVVKKEEPKPEPVSKTVAVVKTEEPKEADEKTQVKAEITKATVDLPKDTLAAQSELGIVKSPAPETKPPTPTTSEEVKNTADIVDVKEPAVAKPYKRSTIVRRSESSTTEGFGVVFWDKSDEGTDTVRILVPPVKGKIEEEVVPANLSQIEKQPGFSGATLEQSPERKSSSTKTDEKKPVIEAPIEQPKAITPTCRELASDKDFMKLRKNMAAENTDEAMIEEAKKSFRSRCYSVEQVRYLSTLFLTAAAKYQFLDASFNHVSDKQNFTTLQTEIKDEYYLKRFKALVGE